MKKKIIIFSVFVILGVFLLHNYIYQNHRDISSEKESFEISVTDLQNEFTKSDSIANAKYLDKTIIVYGKITKIDIANKMLTIDSSLTATFTKNNPSIKENNVVKLKGRFIGYDDLFGEFKMDECTILK